MYAKPMFTVLVSSFVTLIIACPNIQIGVENDTCGTPEAFNEAFEPVYKALSNYDDWEEFYGYPPVRQTIESLSMTSFATIEEEITDETSSVVVSSYGGYAVQQGDLTFDRRERGGSITRTSSALGRAPRAQETETTVGPAGSNETDSDDPSSRFLGEEGDMDCYPPLLCKSMGWCCIFCPCKTRRFLEVEPAPSEDIAREAAKMEEATMIGLGGRNLAWRWNRVQQYANVCEWLADQEYSGCLAGAILHCTFKGKSEFN